MLGGRLAGRDAGPDHGRERDVAQGLDRPAHAALAQGRQVGQLAFRAQRVDHLPVGAVDADHDGARLALARVAARPAGGEGERGDEDPEADEADLRAHITALARRLYGTRHAETAPEVDNWLRLYANLYGDRTQGGDGEGQVPGAAGERAWRGLLVAMLRSPRLLIY